MKTILRKSVPALIWLMPLATFSVAQTSGQQTQPSRPKSPPAEESTGEYIDDATITTKVKTALIKDDLVKAREVKVSTKRGVVEISGSVESTEQKERAEVIARRVEGVKDVRNGIKIK